MGKDKKKTTKKTKKKESSTPKKKTPTTPRSGDAKSVASGATSVPSPGGDSGAAAGSGGGAGAGAGAGAVVRTTVDFDAGQLFERYDTHRKGYLDKSEFQRMCNERGLFAPGARHAVAGGGPAEPSPRTSFDAGRLFQRYDAAGRGRLGKAEVDQFLRDYAWGVAGGTGGFTAPPAMSMTMPPPPPPTAGYDRGWYNPAASVPMRHGAPGSVPDSFDAGRLFERFDKNKNGAIDRAEFERMVTELNKRGLSHVEGGGRPGPRAYAPAPPPHWEAPVGGMGMYGGHLSIQDAYRARLSDLTALTAHLMVKRETMMRQLSAVQLHREHIKASKRAIERETVADTEGILRRLRSAEAFKLSLLQHDIDELRSDISAIDSFHAQFSAYQPRTQPGALYSDVAGNTAMEFLSRYPELCGEADRLATKTVKTTVDVAADDFERETAKRLQAMQKLEAADSLVREREQMIMELRRQSAASQLEIDEVAHTTSDEMARLWEFTNTLVERLESFRMQCKHCNTRLLDTTVNTECDVAGAADGAEGKSAPGRHVWVKVASAKATADARRRAIMGGGAAAGAGSAAGAGAAGRMETGEPGFV